MKVTLKYGNKHFAKGAVGEVIKYEDSPKMQKAFPRLSHFNHGQYYIVRINGDDCLFEKKQLEFINE